MPLFVARERVSQSLQCPASRNFPWTAVIECRSPRPNSAVILFSTPSAKTPRREDADAGVVQAIRAIGKLQELLITDVCCADIPIMATGWSERRCR
jgi:hypothetical protein